MGDNHNNLPKYCVRYFKVQVERCLWDVTVSGAPEHSGTSRMSQEGRVSVAQGRHSGRERGKPVRFTAEVSLLFIDPSVSAGGFRYKESSEGFTQRHGNHEPRPRFWVRTQFYSLFSWVCV